jgi:hypothetical protein
MKLFTICLLNILCFANFAQETSVYNELPKSELYGFGESSHANAQEYESKFELINFLSKDNKNVDVFYEFPHGSQVYIDSFMRDEITEKELLRNMTFFFNKSQSFIDFLKKLKTLPNVNIYGVDMQNWKITYQFLLNNIKEFPNLTELVHSLEPYLTPPLFINLSISPLGKLESSELNEIEVIHNKIIEFVQKDLNKSHIIDIVYPTKILYQYILYKHYLAFENTKKGYFRDSCMYDNVKFLKEINGNVGVVIAGGFHTFKFPKFAKNMGAYLAKYFKREYFVICSQFYEGNLQLTKINEKGLIVTVFQYIQPLKKSISYYIYHYLKPKDSQLFVLKNYDKSNSKFHKKMYFQDFGAGDADNFMRNYRQATPIVICDAILFNLKAYPPKYE